VPPPPPPPAGPPVANADEIEARFQDVLRDQAALTASIDRLRIAVTETAGRNVGIGHNMGPSLAPVSLEELDGESEHLIALLKDKGPRPATADRALVIEHADRARKLSQRITTWLTTLAAEGTKLGVREIAKDLTAPLWKEVARRIVDLYHAIEAWISLLM
jgi:hypothetical protein